MLQTEFLRSLHTNYERILLEEKPEEHRYQYCILSRGGIKGLLECSLRYMNGSAYLYYDITSRQNVAQMYGKRLIGRDWVKDFLWSLQHIQQELGRFLLDIHNILWYPDQIFQDVESNLFFFLYIPYYRGEESFLALLDFLIERIDYEDEGLVECVYKMYEHCEKMGADYLQQQIFEDVAMLQNREDDHYVEDIEKKTLQPEHIEEVVEEDIVSPDRSPVSKDIESQDIEDAYEQGKSEKRGIRYLFENRKKKYRQEKQGYDQSLQLSMSSYAVAEEPFYEEEFGQTIYIEETEEQKEKKYRLYTAEGQMLVQLDKTVYTIGKKRGEVDIVVEDASISRIHARIIKEQEVVYLEDLNSTNGTFKNGLRMQPYEKRKLDAGDEVRLGKVVLILR